MTGEPIPYKKSDMTPNLGAQDQADDIRGGMGIEGLLELVKFVREGGTLLVEGSTAMIFPEYGMTSGVNVESPTQPVRARLDHARRDRRPEEPDRVRLRQRDAAGLLQPGSGAERWRRLAAGSAAFGGGARIPGVGPEHHADGDAIAALGLGT